MEKIEWTVTTPDGVTTSTRPKMKHVTAQEESDKMSKAQLSWVRIWNEMRGRLIEIGEMEAK